MPGAERANSGSFKPGHKLARGGARPGAGRKPKSALEQMEYAKQVVLKEIGLHARPLVEKYLRMAGKDPATLRHIMDKIIPPNPLVDLHLNEKKPVAIQIVHEAGPITEPKLIEGQVVDIGDDGTKQEKVIDVEFNRVNKPWRQTSSNGMKNERPTVKSDFNPLRYPRK